MRNGSFDKDTHALLVKSLQQRVIRFFYATFFYLLAFLLYEHTSLSFPLQPWNAGFDIQIFTVMCLSEIEIPRGIV